MQAEPRLKAFPLPKPIPFLVALLLLTVMAVLLVGEAWADSLTVDEAFYIRGGTCALSTGILDLEPTHPPGFKLLAGASVLVFGPHSPRPCGNAVSYSEEDVAPFFPNDPSSLRHLILAARLPIIALTLLLAAVVFFWARAMFGVAAALLALAVLALEPTVLGHGHLVTADPAVTFGITGCLAAHWRWTVSRDYRWLLIAGLALGVGLLSKLTALELLGVIGAIELVAAPGNLFRRVQALLKPVLMMMLCAWTVVCLAYLPFGYLLPHHPWPAPLAWVAPPPWFWELRDRLQNVKLGHPTYLNGQAFSAHAPWYYFPEALGLKTTIGLLLLTLLAGIWFVRYRDRTSLLHVWWPLFALIVLPTVGGLDLGIRYLLPAYPLMAMAGGSLLRPGLPRLPLRAVITSALVFVSAVSSLAHTPLHLGYFNELAGSAPEHYLSDSNLDWGQDYWRLRDWWVAQGKPPLFLASFSLIPLSDYGIEGQEVRPSRERIYGLLAASLTRITISGDAYPDVRVAPYDRLLTRRPVARIGTSILVFQLDGELASSH